MDISGAHPELSFSRTSGSMGRDSPGKQPARIVQQKDGSEFSIDHLPVFQGSL